MRMVLKLSQADTALQGFDEFMNLVIDDAVEVKQPTKTDTEEKRRELGTGLSCGTVCSQVLANIFSQARYC